MTGSIRQAAIPPMLGALLGGTSVGLIESLHVLSQAFGTKDYSGLVQAVLLYGAAGLAVGLALALVGVLIAWTFPQPSEPARAWTVSFLVVFCGGGHAVARFVAQRDFALGAPLSEGAEGTIVAGLVVFALVFYAFARNALKKTFFSFVLHPLGTLSIYGALVAFTLLFAVGTMINNRADADVAPRPIAPSLLDRPNLLLITVDGLRADVLDHEDRETLTPGLSRLARDATVYEAAMSHSPDTRAALGSVLSSRVPCAHGALGPTAVLPDAVDTLAEVLGQHGYTTGAIVTSVETTASFNFDQGYDTFVFLRPRWLLRAGEASYRMALYVALRRAWDRQFGPPDRADRHYVDAPAVSREAIGWLRRHGGERWFLTVEYRDPSGPLIEHPSLARATGDAVARVAGAGASASDLRIESRYRGEVGWLDQGLDALFAYMREHDLLDRTTVVVTGLQGARPGEHGGSEQLDDAWLRVPLLIRRADADARDGRVVRDLVRHVDVAPTLAALAGVREGSGWQGVDLGREYALRAPSQRVSWSEGLVGGARSVALHDGNWKLLSRAGGRLESLYFLPEDPDERNDLARRPTARWKLDEMRTELSALRQSLCAPPAAMRRGQRPREISVEDCAVLRRLGYPEGFSDRCAPR